MFPLVALLRTFSWQELRHQPWRNAAAALAVMLGVAMAFAVHLINASALQEFSSAIRSVNGEPDLELRARASGFDEALFARVAAHPQVAVASAVLELSTYATSANMPAGTSNEAPRVALRVVAIDALTVATLAPALMPQPTPGAPRMALFAPDAIFLNAAAQKALGVASTSSVRTDSASARTVGVESVLLQNGTGSAPLTVAGSVSAGGGALAVMDIGAAQDFFARQGQLSRIDLRLQPGTDVDAFVKALDLPADVAAARAQDAAQRVQALSSAYRVNLTVLALVALFTGAFLVFSVLSLSVAKRTQQFALLGVLGLTAGQRLRLVLAESALLGFLGSALGLALGTALAALALRVLGGDLGGGYFAGVAPSLHWSTGAALVYGGLGVLAALAGGWWPARQASALPLALALKGLGAGAAKPARPATALFLIAASGLLALTPPVFGIPLGAYASVALLLVGGVTALPWLVGFLTRWALALVHDRARAVLALLALERARRVPGSAAVAVSAVVASLSLAVALTVMVASFRGSVTRWLDVVLPADLYVRTAASAAAGETVYFSPTTVALLARLPGVARLESGRTVALQLDPARPNVALMARPLGGSAEALGQRLPLVGPTAAAPAGMVPIYVSEAFAALYGAPLGSSGTFFKRFPVEASGKWSSIAINNVAQALPNDVNNPQYFVAGIWRDYARQHGTVMIDQADYQRLTGDTRANDLMVWLDAGSRSADQVAALQERMRAVVADGAKAPASSAGSAATTLAANGLEFASATSLRETSLTIFDRSFAVTTWLQTVAIALGLFGVAASFSAQVLARRKEFGLLAHLGLTRKQILWVVAGEGAVWTLLGALAGLALGMAVAVVLVHVVNPQSFHWTMDLATPWPRLLALCLAVIAAGTGTAWLAGRAAAGRDAVLAVKEDW